MPTHEDTELPVKNEEKPSRSVGKKIFIAIVVVFGLIVFGVSSLFAAKKIFNLDLPILDKLMFWQSEEEPEEVLSKAIENLQNIETVELAL